MIKNGQFNDARFLVPSFVYIIGVGGFIVIVQLLMIYIKTGKGAFESNADTTTIVYTMITAVILFLSVVIPLIAFMKRRKHSLVFVESHELVIQEKSLSRKKRFNIASISSFKLYVNEDEKRSSMRIELKSGQVVLLQLHYVLIAQDSFKSFMQEHCNIAVSDW